MGEYQTWRTQTKKGLKLAISFASLSCTAPDGCLLRELDPQLLTLQPLQSFAHPRLQSYGFQNRKPKHQSFDATQSNSNIQLKTFVKTQFWGKDSGRCESADRWRSSSFYDSSNPHMTPLSMVCHYYSQSRVVLYCKTRSFGLIWCGKPDSPLVHVMFCVVQPHPNLDGVALPDPVEDVFHLVLAVLVLPDLVVVLVVLRGGRWPGVEAPGVACSAPPDSLETHSLLSSHVTQIPLLLLFL